MKACSQHQLLTITTTELCDSHLLQPTKLKTTELFYSETSVNCNVWLTQVCAVMFDCMTLQESTIIELQ